MPSNIHPHLKGAILALSGFSFFACGDATFKYLLEFYSAYTVVFYNLICVLAVYLLLAQKLGGLKSALQSKNLKWQLVRGATLSTQVVLVLYGFAHMSMVKTYALVFITPFITSIMAFIFMKEPVNLKQWIAIAAGFGGVLVILRPGLIAIELPALAALASAIAFSCTNLLARKIGKSNPDETLLSFGLTPQISAIICLGSLYLLTPETVAPEHIGWIILSGILSAAGFLFIASGFVKAPAAIAAPFHYVQIIWGMLFGYLFFGDGIDLWVGIGTTIIVGSGLWLIRQTHNEA